MFGQPKEVDAVSMFALVRIHVPLSVINQKTGTEVRVTDHVWDSIVRNHRSWTTGDVRPLYLTHRYMQEDTSMIVDAKDPDALTDFLMRHIAPIDNVRGIWVINLSRMKFLDFPAEMAHGFSRFTVTIDAKPKYLDRIFESILLLRPGRDIAVNYIAYTFASYHASTMLSVLARSHNHLSAFVDAHINPLDGVVNTETTLISKTMRLVSPEDWRRYVDSHLAVPGAEPIPDIDVEDESLITGC